MSSVFRIRLSSATLQVFCFLSEGYQLWEHKLKEKVEHFYVFWKALKGVSIQKFIWAQSSDK